jgi:hypothetical protein
VAKTSKIAPRHVRLAMMYFNAAFYITAITIIFRILTSGVYILNWTILDISGIIGCPLRIIIHNLHGSFDLQNAYSS